MKHKRVECRHCKKGFLVEPGKFPKKLFDHIRKKHPNAKRRTKASQKAGKAPRSSRKRRTSRSTSEAPNDAPDAPAGFVVETVTYRRA